MRAIRSIGRPGLCALLALAAAPAARAEEVTRGPDATAETNGATTPAGLGSGCATGPHAGICADTTWPPGRLGTPLPATPGTVVRVTFTRPVSVESARLAGQDAPFAVESPNVWRVSVPSRLGDGVLAVFTLWQSDDWHGDQVYAIPLGPAAVLVGARGSEATLHARAPGKVRLALLRGGHVVHARTFRATSAGRRTYRLPAARRAHLRVTFTPVSGSTVVLRP